LDLFSFSMASTPRPNPDTVHSLVKDRVALVTGAARGIGFATAALLAQHGARVVLVDLHEEDLKKACAEIGQKATWQVCDVNDWDEHVALFDHVKKTVGSISLLVCNAAVNPEVALLQTLDKEKHAQMNSQVRHNPLADERNLQDDTLERPSTQLIDINVNSVIFGLKLGIHHMKQHGGGRIVVTGSAASYVAISSQPLYTASEHAVLGLCRATSQISEVIDSKISISWIAPWLTLTPMVEGLQATTNPDTLKSSPEDVAWGIIAAAATENPNGKGYWVQGQTISEVEGAYSELAGRLIHPGNRKYKR
jgi:NAD(P)-dependent dehydrogenase (short-subunit alcohol dehydrogenase family)